MRMKTLALGFIAPEMYHLRPLMTYSSPSRTIEVSMLVASELATRGSVIAKAERISPASSGVSHCSCCSGVPNMCSTSMLPVSGAAQLVATGAMCRLRPSTSHSGAYWRLVRPAPSSPGRKRFHSPWLRAASLAGSMIGGGAHTSGAASSCSW